MATKKRAAKMRVAKKKQTPCVKCKTFSVTPSRNKTGRFVKKKK